ncbi:uncharacterized protein [Bemisia tabaci]
MNQQCKVCGEPAAGFHFGAFTCEGCKSFFGRTYNNLNAISECKNNGECIINKKNRTSCKACRLRKCLQVGMSKSGSRYGRRSNWFKIHCLLQEQGSAGGAALGAGLLGENGLNSALYPFHSANFLTTDKYVQANLNGYTPQFFDTTSNNNNNSSSINNNNNNTFSKSSLNNNNSNSNSNNNNQIKGKKSSKQEEDGRKSSDSTGSSVTEDESRSASASSVFRSHHTPSPLSEKDYLSQKKFSVAMPPLSSSSPLAMSGSKSLPFSSPISSHFLIPYISPHHRPHPLLPFSATRPGLTPTSAGSLLYLDPLSNAAPWSVRSGGDLLLCSPAPGGVAVEQERPIDLSVKSSPTTSPLQTVPSPASPVKDESDDESLDVIKPVPSPLDLTNKAPTAISNPITSLD